MPQTLNQDVAGRLDEVARVLEQQGASRFRVRAYAHAASVLRALPESVADVYERGGLEGLEEIPGVGRSIAHAIRDIVCHGRLAMLDRLRGESDPLDLLTSVPGIGKATAERIHDELGIETLEELEAAAHDGRLAGLAGLGAKRLAGIRDSLAQRLQRVRRSAAPAEPGPEPPVAELLDVDAEYRRKAEGGELPKIAPRRLNPKHEAWLPVLHATRGKRHYTALYSNTPRAHELGKTGDWVVLYFDGDGAAERRSTVITSQFGPLRGRRIVRGREQECADLYASQSRRGGKAGA
jgi:hypothetical protein